MEAPFAGFEGEVGGGLIGERVPAFADAGLPDDPVVLAPKPILQMLVGDDRVRHIAADTGDAHTQQTAARGSRWVGISVHEAHPVFLSDARIGMAGKHVDRALNRRGAQIKPKAFAVLNIGQADPAEDAWLVAADLECDGCGSLVQKVNAAHGAAALDEKTADPVAGQAMNVGVRTFQREANQSNQPFTATGKVPTQAEKADPVLAKRIQANGHGTAVRP